MGKNYDQAPEKIMFDNNMCKKYSDDEWKVEENPKTSS